MPWSFLYPAPASCPFFSTQSACPTYISLKSPCSRLPYAGGRDARGPREELELRFAQVVLFRVRFADYLQTVLIGNMRLLPMGSFWAFTNTRSVPSAVKLGADPVPMNSPVHSMSY